MTRTVYLNGEYLPETEAKVSIFDRGFLMADGVYEVTSVLDGKLIDFAGHCRRLARSLGELEIDNPHSDDEWLAIHRAMVAQNGIVEGMIYLQVTRGNPGDLSQEMLRRGIYQVLALEGGYTAPQSREAVEALYAKLHVPLDQVI